MATTRTVTTIKAGDRIDLIAYRTMGDAYKYKELLRANPRLSPFKLTAGKTIEVPNAG